MIRRRLRGVGLSLAFAAALASTACGGSSSNTLSDSTVAHDLSGFIAARSFSLVYKVRGCVHRSGSQYVCKVSNVGIPFSPGTLYVDVTDDGHSILEQGLNLRSSQ